MIFMAGSLYGCSSPAGRADVRRPSVDRDGGCLLAWEMAAFACRCFIGRANEWSLYAKGHILARRWLAVGGQGFVARRRWVRGSAFQRIASGYVAFQVDRARV